MTWQKGQSGNPKGRGPGKTPVVELTEALEREARKHNTKWLDRVAAMAWEDGKLMAAVLKKIIADKQAVDHNLKGDLVVKLVQFANRNNPPKQ